MEPDLDSNVATIHADTSSMYPMGTPSKRSSLALGVLALLIEAPMHPYRIQKMIRKRGKDRVINIDQRASLYRTIERLRREGWLRVKETERDSAHPERTVYEVTDAGRVVATKWMQEILSSPRPEFPEFPVGLSYLPLLNPVDAADQLEKRHHFLSRRLAELDAEIDEYGQAISRLFLLDTEYLREITATELRWVGSLIDDLRTGQIYWDYEWLHSIVKKLDQQDQ